LRKKISAFTLFEVLVALAILSITMVAGIVTTDNVLKRTVYIEKKVLAHWIGMNILNNTQLNLTVGDSNGKSMVRGQEFNWELKTQQIKLANINLLQMQVLVSDKRFDNTTTHQNILDSVTRAVYYDNK